MKIVWLAHRDFRHARPGGAERGMVEVCRRLVARGHEVLVVTGSSEGAPLEEEYEGIRFARGRGVLGAHARALVAYRSDAEVFVNDLAHVVPWGSDLLTDAGSLVFFHHLHRRTLPLQLVGPAAAVLSRVESSYRWVYPHATFVTESVASRNDLEGIGIEPGRIRTIPPGVDLEGFAPRTKRSEPTLVYFAGFRPYKRPELLIPLLRALLARGIPIRAEVAGAGPTLPSLRRRVEGDPELMRRVTFHGRIPDRQLAQLVAESWVNVHLAIAEGWGFSVLEAAAAGTPTAAFRVPGLTESVQDGRTGRLVEEGRIEALADATQGLLQEHRGFGGAAREFAAGFSWDRTTERWVEALRAAAVRRRRR